MEQRACACGATVKISDVDNRTVEAVLAVWDNLHAPSMSCDPVPVFKATLIRQQRKAREIERLPYDEGHGKAQEGAA